MTTLNADEDAEKLDHSFTANRNLKWNGHCESLAISLKKKKQKQNPKHVAIITLLGHFFREIKI